MSSGSSASLVIDDIGTGRPVLILHGGGGPDTMTPVAAHPATGYRVLTPTLPGWNGTRRPDSMTSIGDYAQAYLNHLAQLDVGEVVAIGSSLGGWIAAEMAVRDRAGRLSGAVIVDGAGISVEGRAYAASFPHGRFALIADAGHLPQLEQPTATVAVIDDFLDTR